MLVITRKNNERIRIGNDVKIVVVSIQGQRVKLGIVAAADKTIRRVECRGTPAACRDVLGSGIC